MTILSALLALTLAGPQSPEPEPALLVVEFDGDAKFVGFPRHCPGATAEEDADPQTICTAALYEGPVTTIRQVSGPRTMRAGMLRYTAHAYPVAEGARMLVLAVPMEGGKGLFAAWWQWPDSRGNVCLDEQEAGQLGIVAQWQHWRARTTIGEGDGVRYPVRCIIV